MSSDARRPQIPTDMKAFNTKVIDEFRANHGADTAPSWFFNLRANPVATVEVGPNRFQVKARVADPEERPRLGAIIDYLERQQALTSRPIPIVVLERI